MSPDASAVGPRVDGAPARCPARVVLEGRYACLVPLDAALHGDALYDATHGPANEHVLAYLSDWPFPTRADFDAALAKKATATDAVFFAILGAAMGLPVEQDVSPAQHFPAEQDVSPAPRALGYASYMRIDPPNRVIEVGNVLFSPALQATTMATEAMYLMARHAFEDLGYRRYEWKCNALNEPSKRAAVRLGFTCEGVFRQHMIIKGRNRDTAWYSMLDTEWPAVKARFVRWLDASNFDASGRQRARLEEVGE